MHRRTHTRLPAPLCLSTLVIEVDSTRHNGLGPPRRGPWICANRMQYNQSHMISVLMCLFSPNRSGWPGESCTTSNVSPRWDRNTPGPHCSDSSALWTASSHPVVSLILTCVTVCLVVSVYVQFAMAVALKR